MKISVCVAATRAESVGCTVRSISNQTFTGWELVVIAQGARAGGVASAVDREARGDPRVRVVAQSGSGLSRARNAAVRETDGEVIAFLDDDCEAESNWLEIVVERLTADPRVGILGGAVTAPPAQRRGPANCPTCNPTEVRYDPVADRGRPPAGFQLMGANLVFRRRAAEIIGEFDEFLGPGARFPVADDIDFMRRAERLHVPMVTTPRAVVHHTYGWRYGARAVWHLQRNYARGNGALAAKLTMVGDPRGHQSIREMRQLTATDWLERRRPIALPAGVRRYAHFASGYRECLADFCVDSRGILQPRRGREPVPCND
jgi:glycosyltransferase involved in cell wall biosynthesis